MEDSTAYKRRHEEFVTGLTGGPISEIYLVSLTAPFGICSWALIHKYLGDSLGPFPKLAIDFVLNWLALLLSVTTYASHVTSLQILVALPGIGLLISNWLNLVKSNSSIGHRKKSKQSVSESTVNLPRRPFLTLYRANMMILTCAAILAVDFRVFPRRFAKVEDWGTSLMDMGVGSFVFSMGLVSSRSNLSDSIAGRARSLKGSLIKSFKHAGPVLALGFIRLFFVKFFNYQEHVSEYGVHWNFFMTLGFLPPFVSLISVVPERIMPSSILALLIAGAYEIALGNSQFRAYLLTAPRVDLLSQNREGVFSFIGYLSIFLIGRSTGYYTLPTVVQARNLFFPPNKRDAAEFSKSGATDSRPKSLALLAVSTLFFIVLLQWITRYLSPSRRIANFPYVLFVVSFNTFFLGLFMLIDILFNPAPTDKNFDYLDSVPLSLEAINYNGLLVFLIANVSTGIVNMNLHTLDASAQSSIAVLALYLLSIFGISLLLYQKGIRIKI